jgi:hypothetical protein
MACCDLHIAEYEAYITSDIAQLTQDADQPPSFPEGTLANIRGSFGRPVTDGELCRTFSTNDSDMLLYRYVHPHLEVKSTLVADFLAANPCPARQLGHNLSRLVLYARSVYAHGPLATHSVPRSLAFAFSRASLSSRNLPA